MKKGKKKDLFKVVGFGWETEGGCPSTRFTYPDLVNNFTNLGFKSHVQHSVRFIQHKVGTPTQVGLSCLKEVNQATRCSNADLHTFKTEGGKRMRLFI